MSEDTKEMAEKPLEIRGKHCWQTAQQKKNQKTLCTQGQADWERFLQLTDRQRGGCDQVSEGLEGHYKILALV